MNKKKLSIWLLTVIMAMLITACGSSASKLVGSWTRTDGYEFSSLEFYSDGTYTSDKANYAGTYSVDGDRLRLSGILMPDKTYNFEISGDTLSLYASSENDSPICVLKKK